MLVASGARLRYIMEKGRITRQLKSYATFTKIIMLPASKINAKSAVNPCATCPIQGLSAYTSCPAASICPLRITYESRRKYTVESRMSKVCSNCGHSVGQKDILCHDCNTAQPFDPSISCFDVLNEYRLSTLFIIYMVFV